MMKQGHSYFSPIYLVTELQKSSEVVPIYFETKNVEIKILNITYTCIFPTRRNFIIMEINTDGDPTFSSQLPVTTP